MRPTLNETKQSNKLKRRDHVPSTPTHTMSRRRPDETSCDTDDNTLDHNRRTTPTKGTTMRAKYYTQGKVENATHALQVATRMLDKANEWGERDDQLIANIEEMIVKAAKELAEAIEHMKSYA